MRKFRVQVDMGQIYHYRGYEDVEAATKEAAIKAVRERYQAEDFQFDREDYEVRNDEREWLDISRADELAEEPVDENAPVKQYRVTFGCRVPTFFKVDREVEARSFSEAAEKAHAMLANDEIEFLDMEESGAAGEPEQLEVEWIEEK